MKNLEKLFVVLSLILVTLEACAPECKNEISIYEGLYFEKGQSYKIEIEGILISAESFSRTEIKGQTLKIISKYCCQVDSCQVRFSLDNRDTVFYIAPAKTKRLLIGSDINGNFSVATDQNRSAWIRM